MSAKAKKMSLRQHSVSDDEEDRRHMAQKLATCERKLAKYRDLGERMKDYIRRLQQKTVESGSSSSSSSSSTTSAPSTTRSGSSSDMGDWGERGTIKAEYTGVPALDGPGSRPFSGLLRKRGGRTKRRRRGGRTKRRRRGGRTKRRRRGGRTKRRRRGGRTKRRRH